MAINEAQQLVKSTGNLPVPLALRNAPTKLMKELDYGKGYKYSHDHPGNFVVLITISSKVNSFLASPPEILINALVSFNETLSLDKYSSRCKAFFKQGLQLFFFQRS